MLNYQNNLNSFLAGDQSSAARAPRVCETPLAAQRGRLAKPAPSRSHLRRAFTLVELLVVIAIIGVLIGMTLPGVQMVREAARRSACQAKLHNLGLAVLNFESAHHHFPEGGTKTHLHSWATLSLPFLEQEALYDSIQLNKDWNAAENFSFASTNLEIFACPSSRKSFNGKTDYSGISGSYRVVVSPSEAGRNGILFPIFTAKHRPVRLASITDGTSHTIAIAEGVSLMEKNHGYWACGLQCFTHEDGGVNEPGLPEDEITSHHPTGANAAFCDGSVRFLTDQMDPDLIAAFCTRNGGETVSDF